MVIIDTSVWIPALERPGAAERDQVAALLASDQAAIVGQVMVEVLRGARDRSQFEALEDHLAGAVFLDDSEDDWEQAAWIMLQLKLQGQMIPTADAIIASQALSGGHHVFTHDRHFRRVPGLQLYEP